MESRASTAAAHDAWSRNRTGLMSMQRACPWPWSVSLRAAAYCGLHVGQHPHSQIVLWVLSGQRGAVQGLPGWGSAGQAGSAFSSQVLPAQVLSSGQPAAGQSTCACMPTVQVGRHDAQCRAMLSTRRTTPPSPSQLTRRSASVLPLPGRMWKVPSALSRAGSCREEPTQFSVRPARGSDWRGGGSINDAPAATPCFMHRSYAGPAAASAAHSAPWPDTLIKTGSPSSHRQRCGP